MSAIRSPDDESTTSARNEINVGYKITPMMIVPLMSVMRPMFATG